MNVEKQRHKLSSDHTLVMAHAYSHIQTNGFFWHYVIKNKWTHFPPTKSVLMFRMPLPELWLQINQTSRGLELGCSSVVEWLAYQNSKEKQSQTLILSLFWETGVQKGSAECPPPRESVRPVTHEFWLTLATHTSCLWAAWVQHLLHLVHFP